MPNPVSAIPISRECLRVCVFLRFLREIINFSFCVTFALAGRRLRVYLADGLGEDVSIAAEIFECCRG